MCIIDILCIESIVKAYIILLKYITNWITNLTFKCTSTDTLSYSNDMFFFLFYYKMTLLLVKWQGTIHTLAFINVIVKNTLGLLIILHMGLLTLKLILNLIDGKKMTEHFFVIKWRVVWQKLPYFTHIKMKIRHSFEPKEFDYR